MLYSEPPSFHFLAIQERFRDLHTYIFSYSRLSLFLSLTHSFDFFSCSTPLSFTKMNDVDSISLAREPLNFDLSSIDLPIFLSAPSLRSDIFFLLLLLLFISPAHFLPSTVLTRLLRRLYSAIFLDSILVRKSFRCTVGLAGLGFFLLLLF